jgi:hypothetical protein
VIDKELTMSTVHEHTHPSPAKPKCGCDHPAPVPGCCELLCFERPNYFCGHLLSDQDLMREQQYFREKNKLYHRALHGHGIVCGLRLKCDASCGGYVRIEEGFGIDACGNDLIVCAEARFDVLKALREKGWLFEAPPADPCAEQPKQDDCHPHQCFYVVACYEEEALDYISPFVPGCKTKLAQCEPTRIREGVRFDVLDELPVEQSVFASYADRLKGCFDLFSEGPFARYLHEHLEQIRRILAHAETGTDREECSRLFCELRGYLLLHLKKHPDHYNCALEETIRAIPTPGPQHGDNACADAICKLIEIAVQHAYSCAMNEIMPHCSEPKQPGCIVLGTVEVQDGKLMQVCNCPRKYVWSFVNFFEVLYSTLIADQLCKDVDEHQDEQNGSSAQRREPCKEPARHVCCNDIDVSCEEILRLLSIDKRAMHYRGGAGVDAFASIRSALTGAIDFTRRDVYSPRMFTGLADKDALAAARELGIHVRMTGAGAQPIVPPLFEALRRAGIASLQEPLILQSDAGRVVSGYAEVPIAKGASGKVRDELSEELQKLREQVNRLEAQLNQGGGSPAPKGRGQK